MLGEDNDDNITLEEEGRSFSAQSPLKRIAIAAAGPTFNFILAFLLFLGIYSISGYSAMTAEIGQVRVNSPADKAKIIKGDIIEYIERNKINEWMDIKKFVENNAGKDLDVVINRGGKRIKVTVYPEEETVKNIFGEDIKSALIGIVASGTISKYQLNPFQATVKATEKTWEITSLTVITIVKLFQGVVPLETLGGPIMIGQLTGDIARENLGYLFPFMALISINLAILNLLPVPVLDGGMIVFFLIEMVIKKPISLKKRELAQKVGFFLLILLMVIVFYNDIIRLLTNH
jgi:regulator of sigma E protease